jgi:hypothetical protein
MQVRVADAAEKNVDLDVPRPRLATIEAEGAERRSPVEGGIGKGFAHDDYSSVTAAAVFSVIVF